MKTCTACGVAKNESEFRTQKGRNSRRSKCRTCDTKRHKEWRARNRERLRLYDRKRWKRTDRWESCIKSRYGISATEFQVLLEQQGGKCGVCKSAEPGGRANRFHVDHDHNTGVVRGLLCFRCNLILGAVADDPQVLTAAIDYLCAPQAQAFIEAYMSI